MNEIPVYLFTGFMDSGKTTLVKETLFDDGFTEGGRSVVICCEDGDVEYDLDESKQTGSRMATKGSGSSSMACGAVHRQTPEAGARCVNRARRDLCGGYPVTGIPTATYLTA